VVVRRHALQDLVRFDQSTQTVDTGIQTVLESLELAVECARDLPGDATAANQNTQPAVSAVLPGQC
jgi:hypothetical protein